MIIEAKAQQGFDQQQMGDFIKDRQWVNEAAAVVKGDDGIGHKVEVDVIALASSKYLEKFEGGRIPNSEGVFSGIPVSWEALAEHYSRNEGGRDPVLFRANLIYEEPRSGGENNDGHKRCETGVE